MKTARIIISTVAIATLAGCGGSSTSDDTTNAADVSTTVAADSTMNNDADVMFAQMMIPHHEQAIEMSDIALDPTVGASDAVKSLATRIKNAQDPEIQQMKDLLTQWGESITADSSVDHGDMMSGMMSAKDLTALTALRGAEFDRAWLEAMIAHHDGAVEMAQDVLKDGQHADIRALATAVVSAQEAEISEMKKLLS